MSSVERHPERGVARFTTADVTRSSLKREDRTWLLRWFGRSSLVLFCLFIGMSGRPSEAQETDYAPYARAADFCRGDIARPIALSQDKRILCLDGVISSDLDVSVASDMDDRGIAVVRSRGGDPARAAQLA